MSTKNKRFPIIWAALTGAIDFEGKTVLDVGCGFGDLIKAAYRAKARHTIGIDKDSGIVNQVYGEVKELGFDLSRIHLIKDDVDNWFLPTMTYTDVDVLTCMSVLPYVQYPYELLHDFKALSPQVVLEIQYAGDGPGFFFMKEDDDCRAYLSRVFSSVTKIGESLVKDRNKTRSIWLCEREGK